MTGRAYRTSAEVAGALGPYERYEENRDPHNHVMRKHRDAAYEIDDSLVADAELLARRAARVGRGRRASATRNGYRNAQATVLAPTGTISFLMDCDTTGIEPDFSLVKFKELVGGGQMTIVNRTVPLALRDARLLEPRRSSRSRRTWPSTATIVGAPGLKRRAPAGVRRGGRRARDLAHGPRQDDGRGAAVHLGRDLEDGEPARVGHGRGHRRRLHRGLEARPEGAGDLPRRLEDGAGAEDRRGTKTADEAAEAADGRAEPARCGAGCRTSASRSRTSSRSAATRATSRPACTRTARSARSS